MLVCDKKYDYKIESYMDNLNKEIKELVKKFILSDKNMLEHYLNEWLKNKNPNFIEYLFSSEFDFSHFLNFNNQNFSKIDNYLKEFVNKDETYKLHSLINAQIIKGKYFEDKYLAFLLIISGIVDKLNLLLPSDIKHFDDEFYIKYFIYIYEIQLFVYWNEHFDYIELSKFINKFILYFSKLFIKKKELFKGIINEIAPNIYLGVYLRAIDIAINACEKYNVPENVLNHGVREVLINKLYLIFILKKNMKIKFQIYRCFYFFIYLRRTMQK